MYRRYFAPLCLVLSLLTCAASGEDLKLSDGTVLRRVRVLEVKPDSLILLHDGGETMTDLGKLPKQIRARYGYDPRKAAAHREREAAARQSKLAEERRLIEAHEQRKLELARLRMEASEAGGASGTDLTNLHVSYQVGAAERAYASGVARIGAEVARYEESRVAAIASQNFWTADFLKHPLLQLVGGLLGGSGGSGVSDSEPRSWR